MIAPPPEGQTIAPQPPAAPSAAVEEAPIPDGAQPRMQGPASVANLAGGLLAAVVNISTAQTVGSAGRGIPPVEAPDGSPLGEYFDDLLSGEGDARRQVDSLGSGFVVDPSGIVVTNNHVIADADEITVNFADGSSLPATIVGVDPQTDIAVLQVEAETPLAAVSFGDSAAVRIGDWVMAVGNPFGLGGSVSIGIVSARGRNLDAGPYDDFIQTDAAINRGNSGGPLFDMYGEVIGINTAIISPTGGSIGIGFSIPAALAASVVGQLREYGETRRGWLGVRLQEVDDAIAEGLGLPPGTRGALVMGISPEGPADTGEIEVGDVIVAFAGERVENWLDLPRAVAETAVGDTVTLRLLRSDGDGAVLQELETEVTLGRLETAGEPATDDEDAGDEASAAAVVTADPLGMRFGPLDEAARERYAIGEAVEGVVITEIVPGSAATEEGVEEGWVVVELGQEAVADVAALEARLAEIRESGQRNALLLLADPTGDLRFVAIPIR